MARAFVAKAVYDLPTTRGLRDRLDTDVVLRRICGWERKFEVPSESVFSRAFAEFSDTQLPQRVHKALIGNTHRDRLVGHLSRDSTAIEAREKPAAKQKAPPPPKRKRGRLVHCRRAKPRGLVRGALRRPCHGARREPGQFPGDPHGRPPTGRGSGPRGPPHQSAARSAPVAVRPLPGRAPPPCGSGSGRTAHPRPRQADPRPRTASPPRAVAEPRPSTVGRDPGLRSRSATPPPFPVEALSRRRLRWTRPGWPGLQQVSHGRPRAISSHHTPVAPPGVGQWSHDPGTQPCLGLLAERPSSFPSEPAIGRKREGTC